MGEAQRVRQGCLKIQLEREVSADPAEACGPGGGLDLCPESIREMRGH